MTIRNMVASCDIGYKIQLEELNNSQEHSKCSQFEDHFPGLIYNYANFGGENKEEQIEEEIIVEKKVTKKKKKV